MPSLIERATKALAPDYLVSGELDAGGMGIVLKAHDPALDRTVAIKLLRPELATARAAERFLREARTLAALRHPNVLPVHRAGESDGLVWFVMDYVEAGTLAERLRSGPLPAGEAAGLARALLAGLGAVHAAGIVHRDIKPSNILLASDGPLLCDFGIARGPDAVTGTPSSSSPGTPQYMAPEQLAGDEATPRSDLYATAAVLYEAVTGRRWRQGGSWSDVPRAWRAPLRRGLAPPPEHRFPNAAALLAALERGPTSIRVRTAAVGLAVLAIAGWLSLQARGPAAGTAYDLAVLPIEPVSAADSTAAGEVSLIATLLLESVPGLRVAPARMALQWPRASTHDPSVALSVRYHTRGVLLRAGDTLEVRLRVVRGSGEAAPEIAVRGAAPDDVADALALELLRVVHASLAEDYQGGTRLSADFRAVREFVAGEYAFQANAYTDAKAHYTAALERDSTFALATWRLANVNRWIPQLNANPQPMLRALIDDPSLGDRERRLVQAGLTPGAAGLAIYDDASQRWPADGYVALLYGVELFHRGPLHGVPFDRAGEVLARATRLDSTLAPAFEQLAWLHIRQGHAAAARAALDRLHLLASDDGAGPAHALLLEHAYLERFDPAAARAARPAVFGDVRRLTFALRIGLAFGLPDVQMELGAQLVAQAGGVVALVVDGRRARAIALLLAGRGRDAVAELDSAATAAGPGLAALERAELPVALNMLGAGKWDPALVESARRVVARYAGEGALAARARWLLAVDAALAGQAEEARRWRSEMAGDSPLARLAEAVAAEPDALLESTAALEPFEAHDGLASPWARSVLHLLRARRLEALGRPDDAIRELLWADNVDIVGWPGGPIQAAEVEWILGAFVAAERARLLIVAGRAREACAELARALATWREPDEVFAATAHAATELQRRECAR